jgi:hypothetical protein
MPGLSIIINVFPGVGKGVSTYEILTAMCSPKKMIQLAQKTPTTPPNICAKGKSLIPPTCGIETAVLLPVAAMKISWV